MRAVRLPVLVLLVHTFLYPEITVVVGPRPLEHAVASVTLPSHTHCTAPPVTFEQELIYRVLVADAAPE